MPVVIRALKNVEKGQKFIGEEDREAKYKFSSSLPDNSLPSERQ